MSETDENPRERIGGNFPPLARSISAEAADFAAVTTAFLEEEYGKHRDVVAALLDEARAIPRPFPDADTKAKASSLIKRLRDEFKALGGIHEKEKTPYLRGGQAVDQFAFGLMDKLGRRDKKAKAGAMDILNDALTDYDSRILAEEQERRRLIAEKAAREAREAQEKADREAREAEEKRLAAERARKPEIKQEKTAEAEQKTLGASAAAVTASLAAQKAEEAHIDTLARPADIMRTRVDDGTLTTMKQEPYAEIEDDTLLDMAKLWPFISLDAKEKALRAWAKTTGHNQQMPGAKIGKRAKSTVR